MWGWVNCRDLGQVLDHEGPIPHPAEDWRQHNLAELLQVTRVVSRWQFFRASGDDHIVADYIRRRPLLWLHLG
jgi:hypothetical protein